MSMNAKSSALAVVLMSSLMLCATACGSPSPSGDSSSATTSKSGSDAAGCADLFNMTDQLATKLESISTSMSSGSANGLSTEMNAMVTTLDSFDSSMPGEIRDDWKTITAGLKAYADSIQGADLSNLRDPAAMEKLTVAASKINNEKYESASDRIEAWATKNCPSYAFK